MMTSNVFGVIAAGNLDQAKVELVRTNAEGAPGCRVVAHLQATLQAKAAKGRECFKA